MTCTFFIGGPTASGKSDLAADVSHKMGAEIVNADAFQLYGGLDLLTAKPEAATLAKATHHLIGTVPLLRIIERGKISTSPRARLMKFIHAANSRSLLAEADFTSTP
jgi:tRNA dimethylallyltransferase